MNDQHERARAIPRRALLQAGAAGAMLASTSPGWAKGLVAPRPRVAAGFWRASGALDGIADIAAAFLGDCGATTTCVKRGLDETVVDAGTMPSTPGQYHFRVLGGTALGGVGAIRLDAVYGTAAHGIWSAWTLGKSLQTASPIRTRWTSSRGEMLRVTVSHALGSDAIVLPAQRGVYALTFDDGRGLPDWRNLAMRAPDAAAPWRVELVARANATAVPHVLLALDRLPA